METIDRFRQQARCACLACAAGTAEEIGMHYPAMGDGIAQRLGNRLLANELSRCKRLRAILSIQSVGLRRRLLQNVSIFGHAHLTIIRRMAGTLADEEV